MLRKISAAATTLALLGGAFAIATPAEAATPSRIDSVRATPGPGAGQVTFRWSTDGRATSAFKLETGLTSFSKNPKSGLPRSGRNAKIFTAAKNRRSLTLSAAQVRSAGAGPETGNFLYFRFSAVNGSTTRAYPYLQAVLPKPVTPKSSGTAIRVGTFNVRSARIAGDKRQWLLRAGDVARDIKGELPGIVAVQELSPGRADGRSGGAPGYLRQTTSLVQSLRGAGAGQYRLVRETPYIKPGTVHGTQGTRLLYDTRRYTVVNRCAEKTGNRNYSTSCSLNLPLLPGDSKKKTRSAAYARFQDRQTGIRFWVASVHLDERHSGNVRTERKYDALRGRQIAAVYGRLAKLNSSGDRVIIAGDINSWQNNKGGNSPHSKLVSAGFRDGSSARIRINAQYPTINHFNVRQAPSDKNVGTRIDVIMVRGSKGSLRYKNVTKVVDSSRPSDHNLVVSDLVL